MPNKRIIHDDDEPLIPLKSNPGNRSSLGSSRRSTDLATKTTSASVPTPIVATSSRPPIQDDILKSSSLSGSTAREDFSSLGHHHSHSEGGRHSHLEDGSLMKHSDHHHNHIHDRDNDEEGNDDDDEPSIEELKETERDKRRLKLAICVAFFCVELAGGLWAESLALLSDSFHLLTDITSFVISLAAIYLSHRPSTSTHTFGYHRAEVLGALFSIFLIWGLTIMLVVEAYDRVRHPIDIDGKAMSIVAGLGVFVNIVHTRSGHTPLHDEEEDQGLVDHDHNHSGCKSTLAQDGDEEAHEHGHGHGHHHHHHHVNLNITAATLHVLGDLLSSVGVLISSLVITFFPSLTFLDPVCTFIFSILVICTTIGVFKRSVSILMERAPRGMNPEDVREAITDVPGVLEVKSLHIWSLTIGRTALTTTVYLQPEQITELKQAVVVQRSVKRVVKDRFGIRHCTVQVELYSVAGRTRKGRAQALEDARPSHSTLLPSSSTDALSRNDQDVIFSIEDDDLEGREDSLYLGGH
ncbi:hypothetical protein BGW38_007218, partial [Lunasporangiospora selenospora]